MARNRPWSWTSVIKSRDDLKLGGRGGPNLDQVWSNARDDPWLAKRLSNSGPGVFQD